MIFMELKQICHMTVAHEATDIRIFEKECSSLKKRGFDVSIIAPNVTDQILLGIHIYGVRLPMNPITRLLWGAKRIYRKALELDADIYHFHDIELFYYGIKLKKRGKKVIFDSHEDWLEYAKEVRWLPKCVRYGVSKFLEKVYTKYLSYFDAVITVTPHIVDSLKRFSNRVYMVTNYPSKEILNVDILLEDYLMRQAACYTGTIYKQSNQGNIVKVVNELDIRYLLVGGINDSLKVELENLNINNKMEYHPRMPSNKLKEIYSQSWVGLVIYDYSPNDGYRQGSLGVNKIFEYMAAGLPIICTDFEVWTRCIIEKYDCGVTVKPGDYQGLKNAFKFLMTHKDLAYQMGQNGQMAFRKEFNWEEEEKILLDIYKNIMI